MLGNINYNCLKYLQCSIFWTIFDHSCACYQINELKWLLSYDQLQLFNIVYVSFLNLIISTVLYLKQFIYYFSTEPNKLQLNFRNNHSHVSMMPCIRRLSLYVILSLFCIKQSWLWNVLPGNLVKQAYLGVKFTHRSVNWILPVT